MRMKYSLFDFRLRVYRTAVVAVLALREGELDSRLRERERTIEDLNQRLRELTLLLRRSKPLASLMRDNSPNRDPPACRSEEPVRREGRQSRDPNQSRQRAPPRECGTGFA